MSKSKWLTLKCLKTELQLKATLTGGQSFRWKPHPSVDEEYIGVMANIVWIIKQVENSLHYKILGELPYPEESPDTCSIRLKINNKPKLSAKKTANTLYAPSYYESLLKNYFRLDVNLEKCYKEWSASHKHFKSTAADFHSIRLLNQDPVENFFSFICSQNNHIGRISTLVEKLCTNYGPKICTYDGVDYHAFPDATQLAPKEVDAELRALSFGYRAKFIQQSAMSIVDKNYLQWFKDIIKLDYASAHKELITMPGIGPKVADCICLMSLGYLEAIPVDTHVYQIAAKHYLPTLKATKSVSLTMYNEIGNEFRRVYGPLAGWAQTVLFCADLAMFKKKDVNCEAHSKAKKKKMS